MINLNNEKNKVAAMKRMLQKIDDEIVSLNKSRVILDENCDGRTLSNYIDKMGTEITDLNDEVANLATSIDTIDSIIDQVYDEEDEAYLEEQRAAEEAARQSQQEQENEV